MANGICVYAESYNGELETVAAELVSAAKGLAETTKEKVQAIVLSDHAEELVKELDKLGVDEIYAVKADHDITLQDDAVSAAIAENVKENRAIRSACSGNTTGTFYFLKSSDASWLWYDCGLYRGSGCSERRRFFLY